MLASDLIRHTSACISLFLPYLRTHLALVLAAGGAVRGARGEGFHRLRHDQHLVPVTSTPATTSATDGTTASGVADQATGNMVAVDRVMDR